MKFALSTNWLNRRVDSGEEIAETALALGFDALELGFNTTAAQLEGFRRFADRIPVRSVHAFCPVPLSAPGGSPELYQLASIDEEAYRMARLQLEKTVELAASFGAGAVVLHAGRVSADAWFKRNRVAKRIRNGERLVSLFKRRLDSLVPELERRHVRLALENLPYLEGFPDEREMQEFVGDWVRPWFDIGHHHVRETHGWARGEPEVNAVNRFLNPLGLHIHDSKGGDDHLAPGEGEVDFSRYAALAAQAEYLVFEPGERVESAALGNSLLNLRALWQQKGKAS